MTDDLGSRRVTVLAPAKLTTQLRVVGVRNDGYHLIDAEMVSLDLYDSLDIDPTGDGLEVSAAGSGFSIEHDDRNLVRRALRAVERTASVRLTKRIPAGAGLGGGSSDAAAIFAWAGCTDLGLAASIGADVAFCVDGGRARVGGIGELVDPLPYVEQCFTLLTPPFGVSTPAVYRMWDDLGGPVGSHGNDLEPAAVVVEPRLVEWRDKFGDVVGQRPRLAGSGGTWFVEGNFAGTAIDGVIAVVANTVRGRSSESSRT